MSRLLTVLAGALMCVTLTSAPAVADEEGSAGSNLTRRAHHFATKWFDHVTDEDWAWVRRSTNTQNIPMHRIKSYGGIELDSCYKRPDFGGEPQKPHLRYCLAGGAEWKVVRLDNGWLKMKDVNWYR